MQVLAGSDQVGCTGFGGRGGGRGGRGGVDKRGGGRGGRGGKSLCLSFPYHTQKATHDVMRTNKLVGSAAPQGAQLADWEDKGRAGCGIPCTVSIRLAGCGRWPHHPIDTLWASTASVHQPTKPGDSTCFEPVSNRQEQGPSQRAPCSLLFCLWVQSSHRSGTLGAVLRVERVNFRPPALQRLDGIWVMQILRA